MNRSTNANPQKKSGLTENEKGLPVSPAERSGDGREDDGAADRREEGRHRARVFGAIRDFMGSRNRKRK